MKKTIYIFSDGELKRKQNTIYFENEKGQKKYVPVENTGELMIFGEVTINKKLMEFMSQQEITLHFFNHYGYYMGSYYPREHYNSGYMILKQAEHYLDKNKRLELAVKFVDGAASNMNKVLSYYNTRGINLIDYMNRIEDLRIKLTDSSQFAINDSRFTPSASRFTIDGLMAIEGNIREIYYRAFNEIIKDENFAFDRRSRQPPENRLNALISFGNSLLYVTVLSEIYKTHLDPRIGFLHTTNFRRFTLNLDVAEIFKPVIVDRVIFYLLNKKMMKSAHFHKELQGVYLNERGRTIFVGELDKRLRATIRHRGIGRNVSYRRLVRLELYKIEKHLMGEKEYEPFVAKW